MGEQLADLGAIFGFEGAGFVQIKNIHFLRAWLGSWGRSSQGPKMQHAPGFLRLVEDAKSRVQEITVTELKSRLAANPYAVLVDVREDNEWEAGHAEGAVHLGKGILERDIESTFPAKDTELILYCGGGFRSALSADAAQQLGYSKVWSLAGGFRALKASGWRITQE
jgi:rhodanese-related sulfurtransferase